MLLELKLKNFAIIDDISITFSENLNIITGETGTGKSIIIDAINILLGGKFTTEFIKFEKDESVIEALFQIPPNLGINEKLEEHGFETDNELVVKRIVNSKGKGRIYINGSISNLKTLSLITNGLVNIFGQHQHQDLLNKNNYIRYLDQYSNLENKVSNYNKTYNELNKISKEIENLESKQQDNREKEDFLRFQLKEITDANIVEDEDVKLEEQKNILDNAEKFNSSVNETNRVLYESENSVYDLIKNAINNLSQISSLDSNIESIESKLQGLSLEIEEIFYNLRDYSEKISFDPDNLEEIINRLETIQKLKRKYGSTIEEILNKKEELEKETSDISNFEDVLNELLSQKDKVISDINRLADEISEIRKKNGLKLEKQFSSQVESVGLKGSYIKIKIDEIEASINGQDEVDFLFTANPDQNPKSILKVASGGELSRIMLILRGFIMDKDSGSLLIFDEADSGIGGVVAETIGKKIKTLSENNQVICITHLAQVAKFADNHFLVTKKIYNETTKVSIKTLTMEGKIQELSRMLAGKSISENTVELAKEMLSL